ncbi:hypothetical protein BDW22DRAFT_1362772 [Trametopsis cervina]|nr:hypothetical protein BDW22DRAFT_1362772 [Trametopsis cervina]
MPAPIQTMSDSRQSRPILGHVNLMVDTFLANATADELRAIIRGLLSSGSPTVTTAFLGAARRRLAQPAAAGAAGHPSLFKRGQVEGEVVPTSELHDTLRKARTLYGAGLGFSSLRVLARPVRAIAGFRWHDSALLESTFAEIDADISQALQSSREEWESGRLADIATARAAVDELKAAIRDSQLAVQSWRGVFPFERAAATLEFWKI